MTNYINASASAAEELLDRETGMVERAGSRSGGVEEWRDGSARAQGSKRKIVRGVEQAAKKVKEALTPKKRESRDERYERQMREQAVKAEAEALVKAKAEK